MDVCLLLIKPFDLFMINQLCKLSMVARKSRKNLNTESFASKEQTYRVAGHVRLSVVKEGQYQDSIATQNAIIQDYIDKTRGEMILHKIYVDEKASGTNFERKGFQKMLSDIESGHVNCVIVKDLSRLGRDFLETGYYIEQFFPSKHVRFVSVADEFDTTRQLYTLAQIRRYSLKYSVRLGGEIF